MPNDWWEKRKQTKIIPFFSLCKLLRTVSGISPRTEMKHGRCCGAWQHTVICMPICKCYYRFFEGGEIDFFTTDDLSTRNVV